MARQGCKQCEREGFISQLFVRSILNEGHGASVHLICSLDESHSVELTSSPRLPDSSLQVNREAASAAMVTAFDEVNYRRFCTTWKIGVIRHRLWETTRDKLQDIVLKQENDIYLKNIEAANEKDPAEGGSWVGYDTSYARSHRAVRKCDGDAWKGGPAPHAATTFINHQPGANQGTLLGQYYETKDQMLVYSNLPLR
jgi:hypothetical protein